MKDLDAKIAALEELIESKENEAKQAEEAVAEAKREMQIYLTCLKAIQEDKREERELFNTLYTQAVGEGASESNFRQYATARNIPLPNQEEPPTDKEDEERPT